MLIPCVMPEIFDHSTDLETLNCQVYEPKSFSLPIVFQQSLNPVPIAYSLNTSFHIYNNFESLLISPTVYSQVTKDLDYIGSFDRNQNIYGRVFWTGNQGLGQAYNLNLEKVYVCAGFNEFDPYYNPRFGDNFSFGCIRPSEQLQYSFKILDRMEEKDSRFDAHFTDSDQVLVQKMGGMQKSDSFVLNSTSLYDINPNVRWYKMVF